MNQFDQIVRVPDVCARTGLSRTSIYRLMKVGSFPAPMQLTGKAVGWRESWINRWLDERERTVQRVA